MRRKLVIALLGLGVIAGYGGEIVRLRHLHRTGALSHGCHREHDCRWESRHAATEVVPTAAPAAATAPVAPPAK